MTWKYFYTSKSLFPHPPLAQCGTQILSVSAFHSRSLDMALFFLTIIIKLMKMLLTLRLAKNISEESELLKRKLNSSLSQLGSNILTGEPQV